MSKKRKVLQGSASNLVRLLLSMLVSLVLPPFLVHRMPPAEYSAWVLILQLSAYVNLLDFGLQTAIGKFVAEYDASGDRDASHGIVSTSFTLLAAAAIIACAAVVVMSWLTPKLFHQMPPALMSEVRIALLVVGFSSALALPFNTFGSTFIGLQQYLFPTIVATVGRVGSAATLIILLLLHCSIVQLAFVTAGFNLATAAAHFLLWRKFAQERVNFSFLTFNRRSAVQLAKYGSVLSVWTMTMFLISGLDVVIVGHYQYKETGFYAIASGAANFMLAIISSVFGPLVPAISSMQASATTRRIGDLCIKATRYCVLLLCLLGAPLVLGAYPLLSLWVGKNYASRSALYLQILVLGNVVRYLCSPYLVTVIATGKQRSATMATVTEACVNIVLSIWLVQKIGAVGVAVGTLVAAFISVGVHLLVSIPNTQGAITMDRPRFLLQGLLRPLLVVTPSLCLYPFWHQKTMLPVAPVAFVLWAAATLAIAWWVVLAAEDRQEVRRSLSRLLYWRPGPVWVSADRP
jgi:O-antigen/teichoic acid export membrane protein